MSEWKAIDTCPGDGGEVMMWCVPELGERGWWEPRCYMDSMGAIFYFGRTGYDMDGWEPNQNWIATHWMEQPTEPSTPTRQEKEA